MVEKKQESLDEPWMGRWVLWAAWAGVEHVVTSAHTMQRGTWSRLLCGKATPLGAEATTYHGMRHRKRRLCRKCLALLRESGEEGFLQRDGQELILVREVWRERKGGA